MRSDHRRKFHTDSSMFVCMPAAARSAETVLDPSEAALAR